MRGSGILLLILIVLGFVLYFFVIRKLKRVKIGCVSVISGAVKSGKTFLSVYLAHRQIKRNIFRWHIKKFFAIILRKEIPLKPMLYSNLPLRWIRYNRFSYNILLRKVRIPNESVVLIDEASLLADSMLFKNHRINNQLMLFVKLFGHYSHGGNLIINTQSISDLHFSFKRCVSNYLYIHDNNRYPFFTRFRVREMLYTDDASTVNVVSEDIEKSLLSCLVRNKYAKSYDKYALSIFTDELAYEVDYEVAILTRFDDLKVRELITMQDFDDLLRIPEDVADA